jgi:hypothetical protein
LKALVNTHHPLAKSKPGAGVRRSRPQTD